MKMALGSARYVRKDFTITLAGAVLLFARMNIFAQVIDLMDFVKDVWLERIS
jgi:hypothetical protein